jgi:hypothetical protein
MTIPAVNLPDYTSTGDARIPQLYSRIYRDKFYAACVAPNICNTKYTGELKGLGSQVTIDTIPDVNIYDLVDGAGRQWQKASSAPIVMTVSRGSGFDILITDAQKAQMWDKDFLGTLAKDAREKQAQKVDKSFLATNYADAAAANVGIAAGATSGATAAVAGPGFNLGVATNAKGINEVNAVQAIRDCQSVLDEQNTPQSDRWMVIPTWMENIIESSEYKDESMTGMKSTLAGGRIGTMSDFKLYKTNLYTPVSDTKICYNVLFGHISAISFVQQLANVKYFPELQHTNGAGLCGENIYDWKVTNPAALGVLYCYQNR